MDFRIVLFVVTIGTVFRVLWPMDFEWKGDEKFNFQSSQQIIQSGEWPAVGMMSSAGFNNPGLSIWVFTPLSYLSNDPFYVNLGVMLLNSLTLLALLILIKNSTSGREQELWYWAICFFAVSPQVVQLSRKLWAPSLFPVFVFFLLLGFLNRHRQTYGILFGFILALMGQIQMGGFIFAAALICPMLYQNWRQRRFNWSWLIGFVVGLLPAIPWVLYIFDDGGPRGHGRSYFDSFSLNYFYLLFQFLTGTSLGYSLGQYTQEFLAQSLYFLTALKWILTGMGAMAAISFVKWLGRVDVLLVSRGLQISDNLSSAQIESSEVWPKPHRERQSRAQIKLARDEEHSSWTKRQHGLVSQRKTSATGISDSDLLLISVAFLGALYLLLPAYVFMHYLIVLGPIAHLILARFLPGPRWKWAMLVGQGIMTLAFLTFVHSKQDLSGADFGPTYRHQIEKGTSRQYPQND